jgi:hypothetical protein
MIVVLSYRKLLSHNMLQKLDDHGKSMVSRALPEKGAFHEACKILHSTGMKDHRCEEKIMAKHEKIRAYSFRESVIHFVTQRLLHGST